MHIYDKERILDACLSVFAQYGYEHTSTAALAKAAGVSKALVFHHFSSKKELYLSVLDRCFEKGRLEIELNSILEQDDFFEAREKFSILKFYFNKRNPEVYKLLLEAFYATPFEIRHEIEEKYGTMICKMDSIWSELFQKVQLKEGVDRKQAFELIMLTLDYFEKKYISESDEKNALDEKHLKRFLKERNSFLTMIRYGIQQ